MHSPRDIDRLAALWRGMYVIVIAAAVVGVAVYLLSSASTPVYTRRRPSASLLHRLLEVLRRTWRSPPTTSQPKTPNWSRTTAYWRRHPRPSAWPPRHCPVTCLREHLLRRHRTDHSAVLPSRSGSGVGERRLRCLSGVLDPEGTGEFVGTAELCRRPGQTSRSTDSRCATGNRRCLLCRTGECRVRHLAERGESADRPRGQPCLLDGEHGPRIASQRPNVDILQTASAPAKISPRPVFYGSLAALAALFVAGQLVIVAARRRAPTVTRP